MFVLNIVRTERDSDGDHVFKLNKGLLFAKNPVNINVSRCAVPKLGLGSANRYDCDIKLSYVNVCVKFWCVVDVKNEIVSIAFCLYLYRRYPFLCVPFYFELERQGKIVQHY